MQLLALLLITSFSFLNVTGQNIALGKTASASSIENFDTNFNPYQAIDGLGTSNVNLTDGSCTGSCTRWSSLPLNNQDMRIDLAADYNLSEVRLYWATSGSKTFNIDVSFDGAAWTTVSTVTSSTAFFNSIMLPPGTIGRHVRMTGVSSAAGGFSLYEFEIYGTIVTPLGGNFALNAPAVASSTTGGFIAANATDGQGGTGQVDYDGGCTGSCTYWSSVSGASQNIYVDLGSVKSLAQAIFYWQGGNSPNSFTVDVSNDAAMWVPTAVVVSGNFGHVNTVNIAGSSGRYVRLNLSTNNASVYALYEFEVYGQASTLPVHFTSFTGKALNGSIGLEWKASIDNPTVFDIERSLDGINYAVIGSVQASTPLQLATLFNFTDNTPARGNNFYRLHYTEQGSAPAYFSKVVAVGLKNAKEMDVFPNPVKGNHFTLNLGEPFTGKVDIAIYNSTGMLVHRESRSGTRLQLIGVDMPRKLNAGAYSVQLSAGSNMQKGRLVITD